MPELKSLDEIKSDLKHCGIARFYYQGVRNLLLRMFDNGVFGKTEPKIIQGEQKKTSDKKWTEFWNWHLFKQMLSDKRLMEAYLLEEEIIPKYGTKIEKGKEYVTVKFYPGSATKVVRIFQGDEVPNG